MNITLDVFSYYIANLDKPIYMLKKKPILFEFALTISNKDGFRVSKRYYSSAGYINKDIEIFQSRLSEIFSISDSGPASILRIINLWELNIGDWIFDIKPSNLKHEDMVCSSTLQFCDESKLENCSSNFYVNLKLVPSTNIEFHQEMWKIKYNATAREQVANECLQKVFFLGACTHIDELNGFDLDFSTILEI